MGISAPDEFGTRVSAPEASALERDARSSVRIPSHWLWPSFLIFLSLAAVLTLFRHTIVAMVSTWYTSQTFSHCFLVFPVSLYLIWVRRKQLSTLCPKPNFWGLPLLVVLGTLWLLGNVGEARVVQEFALVAILICLVWTLLGSTVVRTLAFPLTFLFFAVPFGLSLIGPLQDATAWFAVHALTLSNIPAVLENHVLSVPTGSWTVAEACSGIRYLFSSVVLGVIYASFIYRSRRRQILFIAASLLVPLVANGVRAYGIVLIAYLTNNRLAAGVDHIVYGWLFFTAVQITLFAVGLRWRQTSGAQAATRLSQPVAPRVLPESAPPLPRKLLAAAVLAVALVGPAPLVASHLWDRASTRAGWADPPVRLSPPWQASALYDTNWAPDLRNADRKFVESYTTGARRVDLYWALYSGRQGFVLVNGYNQLTNPRMWTLVADSFTTVVLDGQPITVHRSHLESGSLSRSVWTWYWVCGEYTSSPERVKLLQAKARLLGKPATAAVIAVAADYPLDGGAGDQVLRDFLSHASFSIDP